MRETKRHLDETRHYRWMLNLADKLRPVDVEDLIILVTYTICLIGVVCAMMGIYP